MTACGLDFGTSNSAIGIVVEGTPVLAPVEGANRLIPSAIFFDFENRGGVSFGHAAIEAYIGQHDGRLMRALKTILGSALMNEKTVIGHRRVAFAEVVEIFIRYLKTQAEAFAGREITQVVHGRPVHFVDGDAAADLLAQNTLEDIARRAGFRDIAFVYEPIAAAYHYEEIVTREETVLVADIGGGTSDFTVIRIGPHRGHRVDRRDDILSNEGVRIGGTDFDRLFSLASVMPLLGLGTRLIGKNLPMPNAAYYDLATWATINFVYNNKTERLIAELVADSRSPEKTIHLLKTIRNRLGHRIAFGVEDAKIALSERENTIIPLEYLEHGLAANVSRESFESTIAEKTDRLKTAARDCVRAAGLRPHEIDTIFLTGGSSRVPALRAAISAAVPAARMTEGSDFLSVTLGLTREAERRFR